MKGRSLRALGVVGIAGPLIGLASASDAAREATGIAGVSSAGRVVSAGTVVSSASTATTESMYVQLKQARVVTAPTTLLRATIKLGNRDSVFVQTDGTYRPNNRTSAADVYITIDGRKVTNDSLADWRSSEQLDAHPFDAMGSVTLTSGQHTIALRAKPPLLAQCNYDVCSSSTDKGGVRTGGFDVLAGANLSVFVHPASDVTSKQLSSDVGPFNFDTTGYFTTDTHLTKPLPIQPLLSTNVDAGESAVALGSGWLFANGGTGDAMLTMLLDGSFPGDDVSSWAVNDLWFGAELRAPESVQEFVAPSSAAREVSLGTIEFPWMPAWGAADDPVVYSVAASTTMTVMSGGLSIAGVAGGPSDTSPDPQPALIGGSQEGVPTGRRVQLTSALVNVPSGDPGIVFFSAKAMNQGGGGFDQPPSRGTMSLFLTIDGKRVGPRTRQEVSVPDDGSGATIATSYLATGRAHLSTGNHLVQVWGRADGPFRQAWMWPNAGLIWFD